MSHNKYLFKFLFSFILLTTEDAIPINITNESGKYSYLLDMSYVMYIHSQLKGSLGPVGKAFLPQREVIIPPREDTYYLEVKI